MNDKLTIEQMEAVSRYSAEVDAALAAQRELNETLLQGTPSVCIVLANALAAVDLSVAIAMSRGGDIEMANQLLDGLFADMKQRCREVFAAMPENYGDVEGDA